MFPGRSSIRTTHSASSDAALPAARISLPTKSVSGLAEREPPGRSIAPVRLPAATGASSKELGCTRGLTGEGRVMAVTDENTGALTAIDEGEGQLAGQR
jgi:hypothetical protein